MSCTASMSRWMSPGRRLWLRGCALILVGALVLLWTPLLNGYPVIHADSGTYIWSSVILNVPVDRPIGYSLLIRAASLVNSLWSVVVVQALATGYLMFRCAGLILPRHPRRDLLAFAILLLVTLLRSNSVFVGQILADLFMSWIFLGAIVFVLTKRTYERVAAGFLVVFALLTHNSSIYITLGVLLLVGLVMLVRQAWRTRYLRAMAGLFLLTGIAVVVSLGLNWYLRAGVSVERGGATYMVSRLEQSDILIQVLDTYCPATQWKLCNYREVIRNRAGGRGAWYLWSKDSPLSELGWEASAAEHASILTYALRCCVGSLIQTSAFSSWRTFWIAFRTTTIDPILPGTNAINAIDKNYPHEVAAFQTSAQQQQRPIPIRLLPVDGLAQLALWLGFAVGLWVLAWRSNQPWLAGIWFALLVLLIVNAIIVGTVGGTSIRNQERVFWLVPYLVLVSVASQAMRVWIARGQAASIP